MQRRQSGSKIVIPNHDCGVVCVEIMTVFLLQAMTSLVQTAAAITNLCNLCVYHNVLCFIPEGPTTDVKHLVSESV